MTSTFRQAHRLPTGTTPGRRVAHQETMNHGLALYGGPKVLPEPLPYRRLFGEDELAAVQRVFQESWNKEQDFGFGGPNEEAFTTAFSELQGGGFCDAMASGTLALYAIIAALDLPPRSDVIVSPVTDPGGVFPIILNGHRIVVADARPDSYNTGPAEFEKAITHNTRAAVITHLGGHPAEIDAICSLAHDRRIAVVEDCSHAHGARLKDRRVGTFGIAAFFSTMFSKTVATGGCGGLAYTRDQALFRKIRAFGDRGKPFHHDRFDFKRARAYLFPALNMNLDELSCAIGLSTLSKLDGTISRRNEIVSTIDSGLATAQLVSVPSRLPNAVPSPFFHTLRLDVNRLSVPKEVFGKALSAEGVWNNCDYDSLVAEWPAVQDHLSRAAFTPNAVAFRDNTFNLLLNERFRDDHVHRIVEAVLKVEQALAS